MTKEQEQILKHAVGYNSIRPGFRNRYCCKVNHSDAQALVQEGLFEGPKYTDGSVGNGYGVFFATDKAFNLLGIKEMK